MFWQAANELHLIHYTIANLSPSGGTVLSTLLESKTIPSQSITVIFRGKDKAQTLKALGVQVILFDSLDDSDILRRAASEQDSTRSIP